MSLSQARQPAVPPPSTPSWCLPDQHPAWRPWQRGLPKSTGCTEWVLPKESTTPQDKKESPAWVHYCHPPELHFSFCVKRNGYGTLRKTLLRSIPEGPQTCPGARPSLVLRGIWGTCPYRAGEKKEPSRGTSVLGCATSQAPFPGPSHRGGPLSVAHNLWCFWRWLLDQAEKPPDSFLGGAILRTLWQAVSG